MRRVSPTAAVLLLTASCLLPTRALAHVGDAPTPDDWWASWSWEPTVLAGLALGGWAYARGVRALWRRAGPGRGVRGRQAASFALGLLALFVALVSPLDPLGSALFAGHMAQHVVLIVVAAPLLALGAPLGPLLWAMPPPLRRAIGGRWQRARPLRAAWHLASLAPTAWLLHAAAIWLWHVPALYQGSLRSEPLHVAQHLTFLGTALLYWWSLLGAGPRGARAYAIGVASLFAMMMQGLLLATLLTFARVPWYPAYEPSAAAWGLTLLEDQVLGGSIMRLSGTLVYLVAALALMAALIRTTESEALARERRHRHSAWHASRPPAPARQEDWT